MNDPREPGVPPSVPAGTIQFQPPELPMSERVWGFWSTIGLSVVIAGIGIMGQTMGVVMAAIIEAVRTSAAPDAETLESSGTMLALATLLSTPMVAFSCVFFAWLRRSLPVGDYLGWSWPGPRKIFISVGALAIMIICSDLITVLVLDRSIVPEVMLEFYKSATFLPLFWLAVVIAAPVGEEFLFRGFMFTGLQHSRAGAWGAIVFTSLVWAGIHVQYDWYGMITIFVSGLLLGYVRWKTGSLWLCILLHALMNLVSTIQVEFLLDATARSSGN